MIKLLKVSINPDNNSKVDFLIQREGKENLTITLKEKADWPIVIGSDLALVEKWFNQKYGITDWLIDCAK